MAAQILFTIYMIYFKNPISIPVQCLTIIHGRELVPSGVSPNQHSRWNSLPEITSARLLNVRRRIQMSDVEFVKIISIWCLSVQFGRRSMKSIREDWVKASLLATKTYLTYAFVTQQPFGISNWNLDTCIFVAWTMSIKASKNYFRPPYFFQNKVDLLFTLGIIMISI